MIVKAICLTDHRPQGADSGAVIATFDSWQDASNRDIAESYPNCHITYVEDVTPPSTRSGE